MAKKENMAKKVKGKQKQEEKVAAGQIVPDTDLAAPVNVPAMATGPTQQVASIVERGQQENAWGAGNWEAKGGTDWGKSTVQNTWATNVGIEEQHASDDNWDQGESLLQPPHHAPGGLPTIPEQPAQYTQNGSHLSDIGESNDGFSDWNNRRDSEMPQQNWGEVPVQSRTPTAAPSSMDSPAPPLPISIAEAATAAQHDLKKRGKTTSASEAARKMEESRRHSVDPQHSAPLDPIRGPHAVHIAASQKPVSSASAAAAAMEATHHRSRGREQSTAQSQTPANGKRTWTYPKPFTPNGKPPARILPDPSWIHTGGNAWSNKHLVSKGTSAWTQPVETWHPQQPHPQMQSTSQQPSHRKPHFHGGYPSRFSQQHSGFGQHQSWQGWGKEGWVESQGSEMESQEDENTVNIVGHGAESWGGAWGQLPPSNHERSRPKRSRKRKDNTAWNNGKDQGGLGNEGKPAAEWGQQVNDEWTQTGNNWAGGGDNYIASSGWDQDKGASARGQDRGLRRARDKGTGRTQDKGTDWAQDKGSGWGQEQGPGWGQEKAGWGQNEETGLGEQGFGQDKGPAWGDSNIAQKRNSSDWHQTGDTLSATNSGGGAGWGPSSKNDWDTKVHSTADAADGTRNVLSPQQHSQILNSLLNNIPRNQIPKANNQGRQHVLGPKDVNKAMRASTTAAANQSNKVYWEAQDEGWGSEMDEEGDNQRRVRFSPKASELWGGSPRSVPSKSMAAQQQYGLTTTLINDTSNVRFVESMGAGLAFVSHAFFGNSRFARERIHWLFSQDKDKRVADMFAWVQKMSFNLGTYGLKKFLEVRERGGLFVNADFRMRQHPYEPAFDFLTFDQLQGTMDKTLQESVAFYDPARFAMVFVFLPSQSGNSVAIWRQKINVPDSARQKYRADINAITESLRTPKEYIVMVDELPKKPKPITTTHKPGQLRKLAKTANARATSSTQQASAKKSRKWWKFFLS